MGADMAVVGAHQIVKLSAGGNQAPLFCVHSASGSAYHYQQFAQLVGVDRPVYGIEAPGFDGDRQPIRSVPELSAEYAATLQREQPEGGFALLGWSLGGIIALDIARRLAADGIQVRQVILVDVSVPVVTELPPEKLIAVRFLAELLADVDGMPTTLPPFLVGLPDDASSATVFKTVEASKTLPADLDADLLAERYAVFRALVEASYGFEVRETYTRPVLHLMAAQSPHDVMRWFAIAPDLTEQIVLGDHHSIWTGDSLRQLADHTNLILMD
ncbi:MAG: hypothetical protein DLM58_06205 [Pseudonocardiales bacterium]|nr:MAG: hypothetical protein DLM58_06205 [Pseudonocardiales bacterium]